jgi:RNA polymerase sigma-70 factor, ECF subfamily
MELQHIDDASLVDLCISTADDRRVLNELVRRYGRLLLQTISWTFQRYSRADKEDKEDIFQEVFASLFENDSDKLKRFDSSRAGLGTYLATIARNATLNALKRRKKVEVELSENIVDDYIVDFSLVENAEVIEKINGLLEGFTANERLFYHLYFEECMPPEEVSKVMGVSLETVYSKKAKMVEKIKKGLKRVIEQI